MAVFIGSEALEAGELTRHELRTFYRRQHPDVYAPNRADLTLEDRIAAAWLWSRRRGVVCGLAASALHGAKWVDDDVPIELISPNHRAPAGVITRNSTLSDGEVIRRGSMKLTTVERTAFDLALSGRVRQAVAHLDALAAATHYKDEDVREVARRHPRAREIRRLDGVLELVDAGAESPQETRVRLLLIDSGFPRPATQIPVPGPDGLPRYYLDMGWEDIMVAVEYDGEHHLKDTLRYRRDNVRLEYIQSLGWIVVRVVAGNRPRRLSSGFALRERRDCADGEFSSHFSAATAV